MALKGSQKFAILLCRFTDTENVSSPPASFFENLFVNRGTGGLNDYWSDASQGNIDLNGSKVFDWRTSDQTLAEFLHDRPNRWDKIVTAISTFGIDTSKYTGVVAIYNVDVKDGGNAGNGVLAGPDSWNVTFLAHETGHVFGLQHSFDQSNRKDVSWSSPGEYFDMYDIMSAMNVYNGNHPQFGQYGPLLNAPNLERMGWLDPSRVWMQINPNNGSGGKFDIVSLGHPEIPGYQVVKVSDLYIEFRTQDKWDIGINRPAVLIHTMSGVNSVIMASDKTNFVNDWQPGQIYGPSDTEWGIHGGLRIYIESFDLANKKARISFSYRANPIPFDGPNPTDWHIYERYLRDYTVVERQMVQLQKEILDTTKEVFEGRKELLQARQELFAINTELSVIKGLVQKGRG